jgi:hypothetical protein
MMTTTQPGRWRRAIKRELIGGGLFIAFAATLELLSPRFFSDELARRLLGIGMGAIVFVYANALPKTLIPLDRLRTDPAAEQATRRFTGWTIALGGAAYAIAWIVAPLEIAPPIAMIPLASAVLLVFLRCRWTRTRGHST